MFLFSCSNIVRPPSGHQPGLPQPHTEGGILEVVVQAMLEMVVVVVPLVHYCTRVGFVQARSSYWKKEMSLITNTFLSAT